MGRMQDFSRPDWHAHTQRLILTLLDDVFAQNQMILENQLLILKKEKDIMDTQTSEASALEAIATGITSLSTSVQALVDAAANQDNASPALSQAVTDVTNAFNGLSAIVTPPAPAPAPVDPNAPTT
jgi:hypothetical protein